MQDDLRRPEQVLKVGHNCWRSEQAHSAGLAASGADYFRAVRQSLVDAENHVFILAWDIHSQVELVRGDTEPDDGLPTKIGPFLTALLKRKEDLHVYLLTWDFSLIYAAEREWRSFSDSLGHPHPRLHFEYDDQLPATASHHQKVVLIDGALAYAGGLDLSAWRWDSSAHKLRDERRIDPEGKSYPPYHDVQMAVTGPAVAALADLCTERWKRATGEDLDLNAKNGQKVPWPEFLDPVFEDVKIGFSRTMAEFEPYPAVREIERLHLDIIGAAKHYLYFENQYFSSRRIADALRERLDDPDGPEIIIVLTKNTGGWLEESTMGVMRECLFEELRDADSHSRLKIFYPAVASMDGEETAEVYVHAKVVIADDRLAKIGSSNLSNRSMRLDSEIDLTIERPNADPGIRRWLHGLLAIHFAEKPKVVEERVESEGSLGAAITSLVTEKGHSLRQFPSGSNSKLERRLAESQWLDPDEPIDPGYWIRSFVPEEDRPSLRRRLLTAGAIIAAGLTFVHLLNRGWGNVVDREALETWLSTFRAQPYTPLALGAIFFVAGIAGVSLNLLLIAATAAVGPWLAFFCGYIGSHLSALLGFWAGHLFGKPLLEKFGSQRLHRISQQLRSRGPLSIMLVRILPVAPFVVINLAAGASHIRFGIFNLGTFLGMAPGMAVVTVLTHQVGKVFAEPGIASVAILLVVAIAAVGGFLLVRYSLTKRSKEKAGTVG